MNWTIHHHNTVTSTSDVAKELVASGTPEGTVVTADVQTAGRGSRGRKWTSPPGSNMLASIVLYPGLPFERTVDLSFVTAIATTEALRDIGLDAKIKWPNDVLIKGRKICGILIETVSRIENKPAVIVGIGINVNWKDIDPEIAQTATSVALELGHDKPVEDVLDLLLTKLAPLYKGYLKDGLPLILKQWRELQCTVGTNIKVAVEDKTISGKAIGVDDNGSLLVQTDSGIITVTAAGTLLAEG